MATQTLQADKLYIGIALSNFLLADVFTAANCYMVILATDDTKIFDPAANSNTLTAAVKGLQYKILPKANINTNKFIPALVNSVSLNIGTAASAGGTTPPAVIEADISYLKGKKAFIEGDSFVALNLLQGYLSTRLGMIVESDGVGSTCIASGTDQAEGDGNARAPIHDRTSANLTKNPDYFLVQGLSNDARFEITLGDISSTDITTVYGALKSIAQKCTTHRPVTRTIFINNVFRGDNVPRSGSVSGRATFDFQEKYANAMIEIGRLYAIPVIDLFHASGFTAENIDVVTYDGIHANDYGKDLLSNLVASGVANPTATYYAPEGDSTPVDPTPDPGTEENVTWSNLIGAATASGNTLTIPQGISDWDNGGSSTKRGRTLILPALTGAGSPILGFHNSVLSNAQNTGDMWKNIDFAVFINDTTIIFFEDGVQQYLENKTSGASVTPKIVIDNGTLKFYLNDTLKYTSGKTVSQPQYAVAACKRGDADVVISGVKLGGVV